MDSSRLSQKTFNIELLALLSDGSQINLSSYVKLTEIKQLFQTEIFPTFQIKLELPPLQKIKIQKDSKKVVFSLTIHSAEMVSQSKASFVNDIYLDKIILKPLMMDKTPVNYNQRESDPNAAKTSNYQTEVFEFIAIPEKALMANKYLVSGVLRDTTITEALVYLINRCELDAYIYQPDNIERLEQLLLVPGNILENIKYINKTYGIYRDKLKLFITQDKILISPMNGLEISQKGNVAVDVDFPIDKNEKSALGTMSYIDKDPGSKFYSKVVSTKIGNLTITNYGELMNEVYGTKAIYQSRSLDSVFTQLSSEINAEDRRGFIKKTKVYKEKYGNILDRQASEDLAWSNTIIQARFDHIDLTLDDAFRKFTFNFNNPYYKEDLNGNYKVLSMSYLFSTNTSGTTSLESNAVLRKI